jgi:hypothetical protein
VAEADRSTVGGTRLGYQNLLNHVLGGLRCLEACQSIRRWNRYNIVKRMYHYINIGPIQSQGQDNCLSLYLNLTYLFFIISYKVRNHIANYSKSISLWHMMLLMAPLWSNVFYIDKYT